MILDKICTYKKEEVAARKQAVPVERLIEAANRASAPRAFGAALQMPGVSLIAEIKRHSPSKGTLMECPDPLDLGLLYESEGARAISVLTDSKFFHGSLDDLVRVRDGVKIPCLRKDFTIDEYQIYEARAHGADAILLIARILSDQQMRDYLQLAGQLGLDVLTETHNAEEVERATAVGATIIGVNNRDLDTFSVSLTTTLELIKLAPPDAVLVSESGIHSAKDVECLEEAGIDAMLVGEALVTSGDVRGKIRELLGDAR